MMIDLIEKKRDGLSLSRDEYCWMVSGFVEARIPDYQMSAFMMAAYFTGLSDDETEYLTDAVVHSGSVIDLSDIPGIKCDKHSTGGVGDKTTLVLAPLVAAAGVPMAKMSGRGLGHTGGTLDKLESIPGFSTELSTSDFVAQVKNNGIALCGQSEQLVPADKLLYALRDVTGTIKNKSFITSSIMGKKLACGADAIVLDVKVGEGAFMKNVDEARDLAKMMISTGVRMNRKVVAVLSSMQQPLGWAVGNALEVNEALDTLRGEGPDDLLELCLELGSHILVLSKLAVKKSEAIEILKKLIESGKAMDKFEEFIRIQGGNVQVLKAPALPLSKCQFELKSEFSGRVQALDARKVGLASLKLGAGRLNKDSVIDPGAGVLLRKKIGDVVEEGEIIATLYAKENALLESAKHSILDAFRIGSQVVEKIPLIIETLGVKV